MELLGKLEIWGSVEDRDFVRDIIASHLESLMREYDGGIASVMEYGDIYELSCSEGLEERYVQHKAG